MAKVKDFCGFRFGSIHSSDLDLIVVSSSNRYDKNLLPPPRDYTTSVPGGDGQYYFGSTFDSREFTVNVAFNNVSEPTFRKIAQLLANDKLQDLVFDEMPFKTYRAKIKSKPDFKHICFTNDKGERVYKGEGTIVFACYFPYAFGFNKYVVRAADYYKCMKPEDIIYNSIEENPYKRRGPAKLLPGLIKDHYNVRPNMNTPWKGGYPTIEQTQWGELYFKAPPSTLSPVMPQDCTSEAPNGAKLLIDVRNYWKNIPEWQTTAKLLTTPTLDYEQELIFMPQYNKVNFINMETGLNNEQALIGSRMLVYNPGDIPIEFELKMDNVKKYFRGREEGYSFRVNRYNVERLHITDAVDWTGLKTLHDEDNEPYKYGNRYFKILEPVFEGDTVTSAKYRLLKNAHPHHCYMVEPIPREKLDYYIKLFYWQSFKLGAITEDEWNQGIDIANRYREMYDLCITDEERYELYWATLKVAILSKYQAQFENEGATAAEAEEMVNNLTYNYFQNPPEYIKINEDVAEFKDHNYGDVDFNLRRLPCYITEDYIQLNSSKLFEQEGIVDEDYINSNIPHSLFLDTEKRMVYNINEPEWSNDINWLEENPTKVQNFYEFKPTKTIRNEAIEEGHWFKIPPGWSLISIEPVVDEKRWGGKLWEDARPFEWGQVSSALSGSDNPNLREEFYTLYYRTMREYVSSHCPQPIIDHFNEGITPDWDNLSDTDLETYGQFRRWYGEDEDFYERENYSNSNLIQQHSLTKNLIHKLNEDAEYGFLKLLSSYWNVLHMNQEGKITRSLDEWWWKASNYMWANFPPLYWGYMDLLNSMTIKYVPLFY